MTVVSLGMPSPEASPIESTAVFGREEAHKKENRVPNSINAMPNPEELTTAQKSEAEALIQEGHRLMAEAEHCYSACKIDPISK